MLATVSPPHPSPIDYMVVLAVLAVLALASNLTSWLEHTKRRWRQRFSPIPLGLVGKVRASRKKGPRPHAVLAVGSFSTSRDWIDR